MDDELNRTLKGNAYFQTTYGREDEFFIDELAVSKLLASKILAGKKKIILPSQSIPLLGFKYVDSCSDMDLKGAVLPSYYTSVHYTRNLEFERSKNGCLERIKNFLRDSESREIEQIEIFLVRLVTRLNHARVPVDDSVVKPELLSDLLKICRLEIYTQQFLGSVKKSELGALVDVLSVQKALKLYYKEEEKKTEEQANRRMHPGEQVRFDGIKKFIREKIRDRKEYDATLEAVAACYLKIPILQGLEF